MTSTTKGPEKSEWCKVAVTVTNEVPKSDAWKRRRDLRQSRTKKIKGEYHGSKCMSGGVIEEEMYTGVLTSGCFYRMLPW